MKDKIIEFLYGFITSLSNAFFLVTLILWIGVIPYLYMQQVGSIWSWIVPVIYGCSFNFAMRKLRDLLNKEYENENTDERPKV